MLFDYRVKHRGLGNNSSAPRPVVYVTYARRGGFVDDANFSPKRYLRLPAQAYDVDYLEDELSDVDDDDDDGDQDATPKPLLSRAS